MENIGDWCISVSCGGDTRTGGTAATADISIFQIPGKVRAVRRRVLTGDSVLNLLFLGPWPFSTQAGRIKRPILNTSIRSVLVKGYDII